MVMHIEVAEDLRLCCHRARCSSHASGYGSANPKGASNGSVQGGFKTIVGTGPGHPKARSNGTPGSAKTDHFALRTDDRLSSS